MEIKGLQLFPIVLVLWTTTGLVTSYTLHFFKYSWAHSFIGSYFPRSVLMIITLAVCAILSTIIAVIIYMYQTLHPEVKDSKANTWYQRALLTIGLITCVCLTITALTMKNLPKAE
ncbi:uncharacterized protein ACNLHF_026914 [Anomaloglossus baeobatrachus]